MSKFIETEYTNRAEILKFPDHYVALAVTVDDAGVTAGTDGKKIVKAGTVVGGKTKSVFANLDEPVEKKTTASTFASLVTDFLDASEAPVNDANVVFTAKAPGAAGNAVTVTLADPEGANQELTVTVDGDGDIKVSLATGADNAITTTAAQLKAAIEANYLANKLVSVTLAEPFAGEEGTGAGVVQAVAKNALAGGVDGSALEAEGVLLNDVDVTYGPAPGAMVIHGFVSLDKLPEAPVPEAVAALKMIQILK